MGLLLSIYLLDQASDILCMASTGAKEKTDFSVADEDLSRQLPPGNSERDSQAADGSLKGLPEKVQCAFSELNSWGSSLAIKNAIGKIYGTDRSRQTISLILLIS